MTDRRRGSAGDWRSVIGCFMHLSTPAERESSVRRSKTLKLSPFIENSGVQRYTCPEEGAVQRERAVRGRGRGLSSTVR